MVEKIITSEQHNGRWEIDQNDLQKNLEVASLILDDVLDKTPEKELSGKSIFNEFLYHPRVQLGIQKYESYARNSVSVKWYWTLGPLQILEYIKTLPKLNKKYFKQTVLNLLATYPPMRKIG